MIEQYDLNQSEHSISLDLDQCEWSTLFLRTKYWVVEAQCMISKQIISWQSCTAQLNNHQHNPAEARFQSEKYHNALSRLTNLMFHLGKWTEMSPSIWWDKFPWYHTGNPRNVSRYLTGNPSSVCCCEVPASLTISWCLWFVYFVPSCSLSVSSVFI